MAIYDAGTASLAANGTVTGVGTTWQAPLTLIRVGATIVFKTEPVKIYTISEIISDTQVNVYNPNSETVPAGTGYAILAHDGITVQGLAQDVAETLRYYQSQESYVANAVDAFANFDANDFNTKVTQVNTQYGEVIATGAQVSADAIQVSNDKDLAAASAASASSDKDAAAASAQEAADYAASLDTTNLLRKDLNFSDVADKAVARTNLDVYSKPEIDKSKYYVHVNDFGAVADGVTDSYGAVVNALAELRANGGGILQFGHGTYLFSREINLVGLNVSMRGVGQATTILKAASGFSSDYFINLFEATDSRISPVSISDMTIDGNTNAAFTMALKYRHYTNFTNVIFSGGTTCAVFAVDAWLNTYNNCGFESGAVGLILQGANHRSSFNGCSFQGNQTQNLVVRSNGTVPDGNTALYFANCDFEFSTASGIDFAGTDATFDCCYIGEGIDGSVITMRSGNVRINGGVMFFGKTSSTYLASMEGGTIIFDGSIVNGQTNAVLPLLVSSSGGKAAFKNCQLNFPLGGANALTGDCLLSMNDKQVFAPRLGIDYATYSLRATVIDSVVGTGRKLLVQSVQGPEPIIVGLRAALNSEMWMPGKPWALVVTYSSNVDFNVRVAVSEMGDGTVIGTLASSGGETKTAVIYTTNAARNNNKFIEIYRDGVLAGGHEITLYSVSLGDSAALGSDFGGNAGNIYKF